MRGGKTIIFYIFAAGAVFALFCLWYLTENAGIEEYEKAKAGYILESESSNEYGGNEELIVNINTADAEELERLPGIGKTFAERIIEYRNDNGAFASIEDIKCVKGIGDKTFDEISRYIITD